MLQKRYYHKYFVLQIDVMYSFAFCIEGGPLAVTDANLCLGRLLPEYVTVYIVILILEFVIIH